MTEEVPATPAAQALAEDAGVDLTAVEPSGAGDKVVVADVKEHLAAQEADPAHFAVKPEDFTYARVPQTPEEAARVGEILHVWHQTQAIHPLPLEWLVESLKAGIHLHHPSVR